MPGRRDGRHGGRDMAMASPTMGMAAPAFLVMWAAMMAAMMFPTAAPMVLTFHRIQSGKRARGEAFVSTWMFVAGYIAVWAAAGHRRLSRRALPAERLAALLGLSAERSGADRRRLADRGGPLSADAAEACLPVEVPLADRLHHDRMARGPLRRVAHGRGAWRRLSRLLLDADGDPVPARDHEPRGRWRW